MKHVKKAAYISTLLFLCFHALSAQSAEQKQILTFACAHFPPAKIQGATDNNRGHDIDLLYSAFRNSDFDVSIRYMPWKRAVEQTKNGTADGLCACSYQPERDAWIDFSDQLGLQEVGYFYNSKTKTGEIQDPEKLINGTIGVVRSYNLHKELTEQNLKVVPVSKAETGLEMLIEHRVGSFFSFKNTAEYILSRMQNSENIRYYPLRKSPYYVCFSKASPKATKAKTQFNNGLREILYSGEYHKILENYR